MPISINRYVDITSGVAGAQSVPDRSLCGLRFTTDPRVPAGGVVSFTDAIASDAAAFFGNTSVDAAFAAQYASYVSPPPASKARILRFAAMVKVARLGRIFGGKIVPNVANFSSISNGALVLTLGEVSKVLMVSFTGATDMATVASLLQTAIRAADSSTQWASATVTFDPVASAFNLVVGGTAGVAAVAVGEPIALDIGGILGWRQSSTIFSPGAVPQTPLVALQAAEDVTDSFGSLSYNENCAVTTAQAVAVATYVAGLNVKYQFYYGVTLANAASNAAELAQFASTGLILNGIVGEYKESLPAAIGAAIDYTRTNSVVNFMYRQGPFKPVNDVTDNVTANGLDALRVNYYGTTATAGQKLAFFQRGFLQGGATAPLDMNVHFNEQWFKSALQADFLGGFLALSQIPANDQGRGAVFGLLQGRIDQAKRNGTISVGKTLSALQQVAVTQITNDSDAWRDVQSNGYWADVVIVPYTGPSNTTEYKAVYTIVYSKNDVVRKIEGSHNLV